MQEDQFLRLYTGNRFFTLIPFAQLSSLVRRPSTATCKMLETDLSPAFHAVPTTKRLHSVSALHGGFQKLATSPPLEASLGHCAVKLEGSPPPLLLAPTRVSKVKNGVKNTKAHSHRALRDSPIRPQTVRSCALII